MRGTCHKLLAAPFPGLLQTLGGLHYRSFLLYHKCMRMFLDGGTCSSCQAPVDILGDHALMCLWDPPSAGYELRHRLVQQTFGTLFQQAGILYILEP